MNINFKSFINIRTSINVNYMNGMNMFPSQLHELDELYCTNGKKM